MSLLVSILSGGTAVHLSSFINDTSKSVGKNMHFFVFCWFPLFSFGLNLLLQEVEPNSVSRYFVSRLQKVRIFAYSSTLYARTALKLLLLSSEPILRKKPDCFAVYFSLVQMSIGHRENGSILLRHLPCE